MRLWIFVFLVLIYNLETAHSKTVLLIESYHATAEWVAQNVRGVETVLEPDYSLKTIYLDTKRKPSTQHGALFDHAWRTYETLKPDLVIISEDNALKFLGPRFANTSTPVVFKGINGNPRAYFENGRIPANMTGIIERHHLIQNIRLIPQMMKMDHSKVGIFFDESPTSDATIQSSLFGKDFLRLHGVNVEWGKYKTFDAWKKAIQKADQQYDALILETMYTFQVDESGKILEDYEEALKWAYENSPVPIFGATSFQVKDNGVIGTIAIGGFTHGKQAGEISKKVLEEGMEMTKMAPFQDNMTQLYINEKALEKFKMTLPASLQDQAVFR